MKNVLFSAAVSGRSNELFLIQRWWCADDTERRFLKFFRSDSIVIVLVHSSFSISDIDNRHMRRIVPLVIVDSVKNKEKRFELKIVRTLIKVKDSHLRGDHCRYQPLRNRLFRNINFALVFLSFTFRLDGFFCVTDRKYIIAVRPPCERE